MTVAAAPALVTPDKSRSTEATRAEVTAMFEDENMAKFGVNNIGAYAWGLGTWTEGYTGDDYYHIGFSAAVEDNNKAKDPTATMRSYKKFLRQAAELAVYQKKSRIPIREFLFGDFSNGSVRKEGNKLVFGDKVKEDFKARLQAIKDVEAEMSAKGMPVEFVSIASLTDFIGVDKRSEFFFDPALRVQLEDMMVELVGIAKKDYPELFKRTFWEPVNEPLNSEALNQSNVNHLLQFMVNFATKTREKYPDAKLSLALRSSPHDMKLMAPVLPYYDRLGFHYWKYMETFDNFSLLDTDIKSFGVPAYYDEADVTANRHQLSVAFDAGGTVLLWRAADANPRNNDGYEVDPLEQRELVAMVLGEDAVDSAVVAEADSSRAVEEGIRAATAPTAAALKVVKNISRDEEVPLENGFIGARTVKIEYADGTEETRKVTIAYVYADDGKTPLYRCEKVEGEAGWAVYKLQAVRYKGETHINENKTEFVEERLGVTHRDGEVTDAGIVASKIIRRGDFIYRKSTIDIKTGKALPATVVFKAYKPYKDLPGRTIAQIEIAPDGSVKIGAGEKVMYRFGRKDGMYFTLHEADSPFVKKGEFPAGTVFVAVDPEGTKVVRQSTGITVNEKGEIVGAEKVVYRFAEADGLYYKQFTAEAPEVKAGKAKAGAVFVSTTLEGAPVMQVSGVELDGKGGISVKAGDSVKVVYRFAKDGDTYYTQLGAAAPEVIAGRAKIGDGYSYIKKGDVIIPKAKLRGMSIDGTGALKKKGTDLTTYHYSADGKTQYAHDLEKDAYFVAPFDTATGVLGHSTAEVASLDIDPDTGYVTGTGETLSKYSYDKDKKKQYVHDLKKGEYFVAPYDAVRREAGHVMRQLDGFEKDPKTGAAVKEGKLLKTLRYSPDFKWQYIEDHMKGEHFVASYNAAERIGSDTDRQIEGIEETRTLPDGTQIVATEGKTLKYFRKVGEYVYTIPAGATVGETAIYYGTDPKDDSISAKAKGVWHGPESPRGIEVEEILSYHIAEKIAEGEPYAGNYRRYSYTNKRDLTNRENGITSYTLGEDTAERRLLEEIVSEHPALGPPDSKDLLNALFTEQVNRSLDRDGVNALIERTITLKDMFGRLFAESGVGVNMNEGLVLAKCVAWAGEMDTKKIDMVGELLTESVGFFGKPVFTKVVKIAVEVDGVTGHDRLVDIVASVSREQATDVLVGSKNKEQAISQVITLCNEIFTQSDMQDDILRYPRDVRKEQIIWMVTGITLIGVMALVLKKLRGKRGMSGLFPGRAAGTPPGPSGAPAGRGRRTGRSRASGFTQVEVLASISTITLGLAAIPAIKSAAGPYIIGALGGAVVIGIAAVLIWKYRRNIAAAAASIRKRILKRRVRIGKWWRAHARKEYALPDSVKQLLDSAADPRGDIAVSVAAIHTLAGMGLSKKDSQAVLRKFKKDILVDPSSAWQRKWAVADVLGSFTDPEAYGMMVRAATSDLWAVRMAAIKSITRRGPPLDAEMSAETVRVLQGVIANYSEVNEVKMAAISAMAAFVEMDPSVIGWLCDNVITKDGVSTILRIRAVEDLAHVDAPSYMKALRYSLSFTSVDRLGISVAFAAGKVNTPERVALLESVVINKDLDIITRRVAAGELMLMGATDAISRLRAHDDVVAKSLGVEAYYALSGDTEVEGDIYSTEDLWAQLDVPKPQDGQQLVHTTLPEDSPERLYVNVVDTKVQYSQPGASVEEKKLAIAARWGIVDERDGYTMEEVSGTSGAQDKLLVIKKDGESKYSLKRLASNYQGALFVADFIKWMAEKGYPIAPFVPTSEGAIVVQIGPYYYHLEAWLPGTVGREMEGDDFRGRDFELLGKAEAILHRESAESFSPRAIKYELTFVDAVENRQKTQQNREGDRYLGLEERFAEMFLTPGMADPNGMSVAERAFFENYPVIVRQMQDLERSVNNRNYASVPRRAVQFDFRFSNVWLDPSGDRISAIFDWNKLGYLPFVEDFKNTVMNHGESRIFDPLAVMSMLRGYVSENAIPEDQIPYVVEILRGTFLGSLYGRFMPDLTAKGLDIPHSKASRRMRGDLIQLEHFTKEREAFENRLSTMLRLMASGRPAQEEASVPLTRDAAERKQEIVAHLLEKARPGNAESAAAIDSLRAMGAVTDEGIAEEILDIFNRTTNARVKEECAYALGSFGITDALPDLLHKVRQNSENEGVRVACLTGIEKMLAAIMAEKDLALERRVLEFDLAGKLERTMGRFGDRMDPRVRRKLIETIVVTRGHITSFAGWATAQRDISPEDRVEALKVLKANEKTVRNLSSPLADRIDMHTHTYYSDGLSTPSNIVFRAWRDGMKSVAIADHNTMEPLEEAVAAGEVLGIKVVPAVEVGMEDRESFGDQGRDIHVACYFKAPSSLAEFREWMASDSVKRMRTMLEDLAQRHRVNQMSMVDVFNEAEYQREDGKGTLVLNEEDFAGHVTNIPSRFEFGKALFEKYGPVALGCANQKEATEKYFRASGKLGLPVMDILPLVAEVGGVAVFAHPGESYYEYDLYEKFIGKYATIEVGGKSMPGIRGLEVYSSKHSTDQIGEYRDFIRRYNAANPKAQILASLGSDSHDESKTGVALGYGSIKDTPEGNLPTDKKMHADMLAGLEGAMEGAAQATPGAPGDAFRARAGFRAMWTSSIAGMASLAGFATAWLLFRADLGIFSTIGVLGLGVLSVYSLIAARDFQRIAREVYGRMLDQKYDATEAMDTAIARSVVDYDRFMPAANAYYEAKAQVDAIKGDIKDVDKKIAGIDKDLRRFTPGGRREQVANREKARWQRIKTAKGADLHTATATMATRFAGLLAIAGSSLTGQQVGAFIELMVESPDTAKVIVAHEKAERWFTKIKLGAVAHILALFAMLPGIRNLLTRNIEIKKPRIGRRTHMGFYTGKMAAKGYAIDEATDVLLKAQTEVKMPAMLKVGIAAITIKFAERLMYAIAGGQIIPDIVLSNPMWVLSVAVLALGFAWKIKGKPFFKLSSWFGGVQWAWSLVNRDEMRKARAQAEAAQLLVTGLDDLKVELEGRIADGTMSIEYLRNVAPRVPLPEPGEKIPHELIYEDVFASIDAAKAEAVAINAEAERVVAALDADEGASMRFWFAAEDWTKYRRLTVEGQKGQVWKKLEVNSTQKDNADAALGSPDYEDSFGGWVLGSLDDTTNPSYGRFERDADGAVVTSPCGPLERKGAIAYDLIGFLEESDEYQRLREVHGEADGTRRIAVRKDAMGKEVFEEKRIGTTSPLLATRDRYQKILLISFGVAVVGLVGLWIFNVGIADLLANIPWIGKAVSSVVDVHSTPQLYLFKAFIIPGLMFLYLTQGYKLQSLIWRFFADERITFVHKETKNAMRAALDNNTPEKDVSQEMLVQEVLSTTNYLKFLAEDSAIDGFRTGMLDGLRDMPLTSGASEFVAGHTGTIIADENTADNDAIFKLFEEQLEAAVGAAASAGHTNRFRKMLADHRDYMQIFLHRQGQDRLIGVIFSDAFQAKLTAAQKTAISDGFGDDAVVLNPVGARALEAASGIVRTDGVEKTVLTNDSIMEMLTAAAPGVDLNPEQIYALATMTAPTIGVVRPTFRDKLEGQENPTRYMMNSAYPLDRMTLSTVTDVGQTPKIIGVRDEELYPLYPKMDGKVFVVGSPVGKANEPGMPNKPRTKPNDTNYVVADWVMQQDAENERAVDERRQAEMMMPEIYVIYDGEDEAARLQYWTIGVGFTNINATISYLIEEAKTGEIDGSGADVFDWDRLLPSHLSKNNPELYSLVLHWGMDPFDIGNMMNEYKAFSTIKDGDDAQVIEVKRNFVSVWPTPNEYVLSEIEQREGPTMMQGVLVQIPYGPNKYATHDYRSWSPVKKGSLAPRDLLTNFMSLVSGCLFGWGAHIIMYDSPNAPFIILPALILGYMAGILLFGKIMQVLRHRGGKVADLVERVTQHRPIFHLDGTTNFIGTMQYAGRDNSGKKTKRTEWEELTVAMQERGKDPETPLSPDAILLLARMEYLKTSGWHPGPDTTEDKRLGERFAERKLKSRYMTDEFTETYEAHGSIPSLYDTFVAQRSRWVMLVSMAQFLAAGLAVLMPIGSFMLSGWLAALYLTKQNFIVGMVAVAVGFWLGAKVGRFIGINIIRLGVKLGYVKSVQAAEDRISQIGWQNYYTNLLLDSGFMGPILTHISYVVTGFFLIAVSVQKIFYPLFGDGNYVINSIQYFGDAIMKILSNGLGFIPSTETGVAILFALTGILIVHMIIAHTISERVRDDEGMVRRGIDLAREEREKAYTGTPKDLKGVEKGFQKFLDTARSDYAVGDVIPVGRVANVARMAELEIEKGQAAFDALVAKKKPAMLTTAPYESALTLIRHKMRNGEPLNLAELEGYKDGIQKAIDSIVKETYDRMAQEEDDRKTGKIRFKGLALMTGLGSMVLSIVLSNWVLAAFGGAFFALFVASRIIPFSDAKDSRLIRMLPPVMNFAMLGTIIAIIAGAPAMVSLTGIGIFLTAGLVLTRRPIGMMSYFYWGRYFWLTFGMPQYYLKLMPAAYAVLDQLMNRLDNYWPLTSKDLPLDVKRGFNQSYYQVMAAEGQQGFAARASVERASSLWKKFKANIKPNSNTGIAIWSFYMAIFAIAILAYAIPKHTLNTYKERGVERVEPLTGSESDYGMGYLRGLVDNRYDRLHEEFTQNWDKDWVWAHTSLADYGIKKAYEAEHGKRTADDDIPEAYKRLKPESKGDALVRAWIAKPDVSFIAVQVRSIVDMYQAEVDEGGFTAHTAQIKMLRALQGMQAVMVQYGIDAKDVGLDGLFETEAEFGEGAYVDPLKWKSYDYNGTSFVQHPEGEQREINPGTEPNTVSVPVGLAAGSLTTRSAVFQMPVEETGLTVQKDAQGRAYYDFGEQGDRYFSFEVKVPEEFLSRNLISPNGLEVIMVDTEGVNREGDWVNVTVDNVNNKILCTMFPDTKEGFNPHRVAFLGFRIAVGNNSMDISVDAGSRDLLEGTFTVGNFKIQKVDLGALSPERRAAVQEQALESYRTSFAQDDVKAQIDAAGMTDSLTDFRQAYARAMDAKKHLDGPQGSNPKKAPKLRNKMRRNLAQAAALGEKITAAITPAPTKTLAAHIFGSEAANWFVRVLFAPAIIPHEIAHLFEAIVSGRSLKGLRFTNLFTGMPSEVRGPRVLAGMAMNLAIGLVGLFLYSDASSFVSAALLVGGIMNLAVFTVDLLLPIFMAKYRPQSDLFKAFRPDVIQVAEGVYKTDTDYLQTYILTRIAAVSTLRHNLFTKEDLQVYCKRIRDLDDDALDDLLMELSRLGFLSGFDEGVYRITTGGMDAAEHIMHAVNGTAGRRAITDEDYRLLGMPAPEGEISLRSYLSESAANIVKSAHRRGVKAVIAQGVCAAPVARLFTETWNRMYDEEAPRIFTLGGEPGVAGEAYDGDGVKASLEAQGITDYSGGPVLLLDELYQTGESNRYTREILNRDLGMADVYAAALISSPAAGDLAPRPDFGPASDMPNQMFEGNWNWFTVREQSIIHGFQPTDQTPSAVMTQSQYDAFMRDVHHDMDVLAEETANRYSVDYLLEDVEETVARVNAKTRPGLTNGALVERVEIIANSSDYVFDLTSRMRVMAERNPDDFVEIVASYDLGRGDIRNFTLYYPKVQILDAMGPNTREKLRVHFLSFVYNGLVSVGARRMNLYFEDTDDANNYAIGNIARNVLETIRQNPESYGRILGTLKRINNGHDVEMNVKYLSEYPMRTRMSRLIYRARKLWRDFWGARSLRREFPGIKDTLGTYLGIDVGGSDIKVAIVKDGRTLLVKKFQWITEEKGTTKPADLTKGAEFEEVVQNILDTALIKHELDNIPLTSERLVRLKQRVDEIFGQPKVKAEASEVLPVLAEARSLGIDGRGRIDAIGLSWPDIVIGNRIVGGDTSKTKSLDPASEFERVITPLPTTLKGVYDVPVYAINDGNIGSFYIAVEKVQGDILTFASGTSFGPGYVDASGNTTPIPMHMSNVVTSMDSRPETGNKVTGIMGVSQFFMAQNLPVYLAENGAENIKVNLDAYYQRVTAGDPETTLKAPVGPRDKLELLQHMLENSTNTAERRNAEMLFREVGKSYGMSTGEIFRFFKGTGITEIPVFGQIFEGRSGEIIVKTANDVLAKAYPGLTLVMGEDMATFGQAEGAAYFAIHNMKQTGVTPRAIRRPEAVPSLPVTPPATTQEKIEQAAGEGLISDEVVVAAMFLMDDTAYGTAARDRIADLADRGEWEELAKFVLPVAGRRHNIDAIYEMLDPDKPYKGPDVIIISSMTKAEADMKQAELDAIFAGITTAHGKPVRVLSVVEEGWGADTKLEPDKKNGAGNFLATPAAYLAASKAMAERYGEDLDALWEDGKARIMMVHNAGDAKRATPNSISYDNSRGSQSMIGTLTVGEREIPLTLLTVTVLTNLPVTISNDGSSLDVFWASQTLIGSKAADQMEGIGTTMFGALGMDLAGDSEVDPAALKMFGHFYQDASGTTGFIAQDTYTGDPAAFQARRSGFNKLIRDMGSQRFSRQLFKDLLGQFAGVIDARSMKIDLSPQIVQPLFVILEGMSKFDGTMTEYTVESVEAALEATPHETEGNYLNKLRTLKDIRDKISIPVVGADGQVAPGTGVAGEYYKEIIRIFIAGMAHVGNDADAYANLIGVGTVDDTYWWTYRSPRDKANADFEMIADMAGHRVEIGADGEIVTEGTELTERDLIKAEDHRRLRRIVNPVDNVIINGRAYSFSLEEVAEGVEVDGVKIKGSIVRNCTLLPGSEIVNSIVVGVKGEVRAEASEILDSMAPYIEARASSVVNVIMTNPIIAHSRTMGGIYRPGITDARTGVDDATIFDAAIGFNGKDTDGEVVGKDEGDRANIESAKDLRDNRACNATANEKIRKAARIKSERAIGVSETVEEDAEVIISDDDFGRNNTGAVMFKMGIPEATRKAAIDRLEASGIKTYRFSGSYGDVGMDVVLDLWSEGIVKSLKDMQVDGIAGAEGWVNRLESRQKGQGADFERWFRSIQQRYADNEAVKILAYSMECLDNGVEVVLLNSRVSRRQLAMEYGGIDLLLSKIMEGEVELSGLRQVDRERVMNDLRQQRVNADLVMNAVPFQDFVKHVVVGATNVTRAKAETLRGGIIKPALGEDGALYSFTARAEELGVPGVVGFIANGIHCATYEAIVGEKDVYTWFRTGQPRPERETAGIVLGVAGVSQADLDARVDMREIGGVKLVAIAESEDTEGMMAVLDARREVYGAYASGLIDIKDVNGQGLDLENVVREFVRSIEQEDARHFQNSPETVALNAGTIEGIRSALSDIARRLSVPMSMRFSDLSMYEYRFDRIASVRRVTSGDKALGEKLAAMKRSGRQKVATFRAGSVAELRWLADEHRRALDKYGRDNYPIRMHVRLTDDKVNAENLELVLEKAGVSDVLSAEDISLGDGDTMGEVYDMIAAKGIYGDITPADIAICDGRELAVDDAGHLEESAGSLMDRELLFVKMDAGVASQGYMATVALMANNKDLGQILPEGAEMHAVVINGRTFIVVRPIEPIDIDGLRNEIEEYELILMAA